jgi:FkbM family methyltransferase
MIRKIKKNEVTFFVQGSGDFWDSFEKGEWEVNTIRMLDHFLSPTDVMVDVGAWIGPISLYAGSLVSRCFSLEPDPVAFKEFHQNISLNPEIQKKITPYQRAITTNGQNIRLYSRFSHGDSGSSMLKRVKSTNEFVEVGSFTFQNFLSTNGIDRVNFIKMDVEGGEYFILPPMMPYLREAKPTLLISFHHAALTEYLESKMLPFGALRRLYRYFDPQRSWLRNSATRMMKKLILTLDHYPTKLDGKSRPVKLADIKPADFEKMDMMLFSYKNP